MTQPGRSRWAWLALVAGVAGCTLSMGFAAAATTAAPATVSVPSLDARDGVPLPMPGFWFPLAGEAKRPALVLLHGCGGPYDRQGRLSRRMLDYAALLNGAGFHALVIDSLTPRGESELCTQRYGGRVVTMRERRRDALGALAWLAAQPQVDAARLGLLGWSHGGSTVLASLQRGHPEVAAATIAPAFAVAFYPGCVEPLKARWRPTAPLLMLLGAADDWTPAAPCEALAGAVNGDATLAASWKLQPAVQVRAYADAHHGFDGTAPVVHRRDVPNGVHPGQGVHVGVNPAAREASQAALRDFLRQAASPQRP